MAGAHRADSSRSLIAALIQNLTEQRSQVLALARSADWNIRQIDLIESDNPDVQNARLIFDSLLRRDFDLAAERYSRAIEILQDYMERF